MDRLLAMQAFVRVVESGTFVKAADSMHLPKPTVTRLIQGLEAHLRTQLLHRTTRRVTVTPDGAAYYDRALRVLGDIEELESDLSHANANPHGRLRVGVGSAVGLQLLIPALPDFVARYPQIQIDLAVSDRPVDLVAENVDCVLRGGEIADPSLVARRIGELPAIVCATPGYLKRHGTPRHPLDLERDGHTLVNRRSPGTGRALAFEFSKDGEQLTIHGRHAVSVDDSNANIAAGLAGLGIVRTTTLMAQSYIDAGLLAPLLNDWRVPAVPMHVVYPPNRQLGARVRAFIDWVAELFARHDLARRPVPPFEARRALRADGPPTWWHAACPRSRSARATAEHRPVS
jgi:DNA-binding transcriptional LysR family regulator